MNLGCHVFTTIDLRAIYELVNFDVAVAELQRGILSLCCLRPNWPESILFRCLEYRLEVLNQVGWFVIDNVKLLESVFSKQNS